LTARKTASSKLEASSNERLLNVVRDDSVNLIIHDDNAPANITCDIFSRMYDVRDSHVSSVNIHSDTGVTGKTTGNVAKKQRRNACEGDAMVLWHFFASLRRCVFA
jgi:hypothetical protein